VPPLVDDPTTVALSVLTIKMALAAMVFRLRNKSS
jgi:hypothetical protein